MQKIIQPEADVFLAKKRRHRRWAKVVSVLGCVVVFCTTYALILPAITAEKTVCGFEEHTHSDECYSPLPAEAKTVLSCTYESLGVHSHTESCYDGDGNLICGQADYVVHTHDENCYDADGALVCTLPERTAHVHTDACYTLAEEGHVHTDSCYELQQGELICGLEENEEHQHGPDCYEQISTLVCPLEEQSVVSVLVLTCGEVEAPVHQHTESCFETVEPVRELICALPEHVHTEACYEELTPGDPTADLETAEDWEATMSGVVLTGDYRTDLLTIAETQLGYHESTRNFIIDEAGFVKGYTRYGEWYGIPYGDWCAMFVSFCLRYAEVPNFPYNCGCTTWINALSAEEYGLYEKAGEYEPQPGDIIFFDFDGDLASDHVGIVAELIEETETEKAKLRTIEGNAADCVCYVSYDLNDSRILGFALLPENEPVADIDLGEASADEQNTPASETPAEAVDNMGTEEYDDELLDASAEGIQVFSLRAEPSVNETLSIHVEKQWVGDASYTRPDSITVNLLSNGAETGQSLTLSADNNWSSAFNGNFPKYDENGTEIVYTIEEGSITNYELVSNSYTDTASAVDLSSFELWVPVTELVEGENYLVISGLAGKQSLYRAESSITDGVLSASVTVNEGSARDLDGNAYTRYILLNSGEEPGQSYYLTWKAVSADGGMNLQSNVYITWTGSTKYLLSNFGKLKVSGDGTLSGTIFYPDGNEGFLTEGSNVSLYLFKQVSLDISSLPASSYTRNYTLVNRYEPLPPSTDPDSPPQATTTSVNVTKQWADDADHSNDSVTVRLVCDSEPTEQTAVLNEENGWTYCFENLPIYNKDGTEYVYDVLEEGTSAYRAEYQYETTSKAGEAVWLPTSSFEDGGTYLIVTSAGTGNVTGMEASSKGFAWTSGAGAGTVYVSTSELYPRYITDEEAQQHTAMQWTAEDLGIQKGQQVGYRHVFALKNVQYGSYAKNNGQGDLSNDCKDQATWWYYGYTLIDENGGEAKRYPKKTPESDWSYILGSMNDYFLLDNNHTGDGGSQAAQTFYLYRRYEIQEPQLNVTITNSPIAMTRLSVLKDWIKDDPSARPESITIRLLANAQDTGQALILSAETEWKGSFESLPMTDAAGNKIEYTVEEESVPGYISSYFYSTEDEESKVVITNRPQPVLPETGGIGTQLYITGGLLLMTLAGLLLFYIHFKRRKEDLPSS